MKYKWMSVLLLLIAGSALASSELEDFANAVRKGATDKKFCTAETHSRTQPTSVSSAYVVCDGSGVAQKIFDSYVSDQDSITAIGAALKDVGLTMTTCHRMAQKAPGVIGFTSDCWWQK